MPHGTGVATYALNLSRALTGMGATVDVLFALNASRRTDEALREVLLFEHLGGIDRRPPHVIPRWLRDATIAPWERRAIETPIRRRVAQEPLAQQLPQFDRILTSPDVFDYAARYFRRYGRFLTLSAPNPPKIMHWTYPLPIWMKGAYNVYAIHDLVPLRLPYATMDHKRYYYRLVEACLDGGDAVCTVSETSLADIREFFPAAAAERLSVTFQAVEPVQATWNDDAPRALGLTKQGYFLYFGAVEPKKNVGRLLEAFLQTDCETPLVIVGAKSWLADDELRLLGEQRSGPRRVRQLDYLPRSTLQALVRSARAVLFPSLYEGFGLPALETMMAGVPLLTSTAGALLEVVGDAALVVDPYDIGGISQAIALLDRDEALRRDLSERGRKRAALFSMGVYQKRLADFYAGIGARPRRGAPPARVRRSAA